MAVERMHTAFAKQVERSEPIFVTRDVDLPESQSLEAVVDGKPDPLESLLVAEELTWREAQVTALPEKTRLTVQLRLEGKSYKEIAADRGITVGTVNDQLKKATATLKAAGGKAP